MVETYNLTIANQRAIAPNPAAQNPAEQIIEASYPLSAMQQGMVFNSLYKPQSGVEVEQIVCTIHEIDVDCLIQAWEKLFTHHAVLRTSITGLGTESPLQIVYQAVDLPFTRLDWQDIPTPDQPHQLKQYLQSDRNQGFNLLDAQTPLTRLTLIQLGENRHRLLWTFHHVLLDGRSMRRLLEEFFSVYATLQRGETPVLKSSRRYRDHIAWLQTQDLQLAKPFWQELLQGITQTTPLPVCLKAPSTITENHTRQLGHAQVQITLSIEETTAIAQFTSDHTITPNTFVQAAWALLLSRHSNESGSGDVVFGAVRACRRSSVEEADTMVGLLMNSLPVRVNVNLDQDLIPWLQALRAQHVAIRPYEHTPLTEVQGWSELPRGVPLFESLIMFEHGDLTTSGGEKGAIELIEQPSLPLVLIAHWQEQLALRISYDRSRFAPDTAERLIDQLKTILTGMVPSADKTLGEVPWITQAETTQLLQTWNQTQAHYSQNTLIHEPFEAQAARNPNAIALLFTTASGPAQLTYGQLNAKANQLAHYLNQCGIGAGDAVGVYLDRSLEMVWAILGIFKAGAAYIPLEPTFPVQRVAWILQSQSVRCVVSQSRLEIGFDLPKLEQWVNVDRIDLSSYSDQNLSRQADPEDTAYMIFTSGSTGTPKGVIVKHRPVINLIEWVNRTFNINEQDRLLFVTSICFDLSVYDMFGMLAAGGSIYIASSEEIREARSLIDLLNYGGITFWDSAPPALQRLSPLFSEVRSPDLRLVFMSGDWIPITLPNLLKETFSKVQVVSLGGATEATVWSNYFEIEAIDPSWSSIPYGKPIQNAQYYILDKQLNPCPIGVTGELYIGGDCLATGYNDALKTAMQFIPAPKPITQCDRLYRTGDLARFFPDGNIEFLGRIDHQVKVRGYRIELGEIESVLAQHPQVATSIAMAIGPTREDKQLVAYVVQKPGIHSALSKPHVQELQDFLRKRLPEYMIPASILFIEALPITSNGKLDRTALPKPESLQSSSNSFVSPEKGLERKLAELWEQVLGVAPVGRHDSFFELGGHSLLAVKLIARIERTLDARVPIASLFQAPTVSEMAALLRQDYALTPWTTIEVRSGNRNIPPIFWCQSYGEIKNALPMDQPIYGLESGVLEIRDPKTHIKTWATGYVEQIRAIQPQGPYYLGGYCFGGYIALEIAHQLRQAGETVAILALAESYGPAIPYYQKNFSFYSSFLLLLSMKRRLKGRLESHREYSSLMESHAQIDNLIPHPLIQAAVRNYDRPQYDGNVALFASNISHLGSSLQPYLGWGKTFTGDPQVWKITGGHYSIFSAPHLQVLAAALRGCFKQFHHAQSHEYPEKTSDFEPECPSLTRV
jgi:amino acid adenylation domain-containing protein